MGGVPRGDASRGTRSKTRADSAMRRASLGGTGRGEVHVEAGAPGQPAAIEAVALVDSECRPQ